MYDADLETKIFIRRIKNEEKSAQNSADLREPLI